MNRFFSFQTIPYKGVFHMLCQRESKNWITILRYFHTWWLYSPNNEKTEDITTFAYY